MSCLLINGYKDGCKVQLGGIYKVYFAPFVQYPQERIVLSGASELISYPPTQIFLFEQTNEMSITQTQKMDIFGKSTEVQIELQTTNKKDHYEISKFINNNYIIIIEDRNGNILIFGSRNGLTANSVVQETGKGKSDFTGYKITFGGLEIDKAYFISDLADAGFSPKAESTLLLLQDGFYVLMQNTDKINYVN